MIITRLELRAMILEAVLEEKKRRKNRRKTRRHPRFRPPRKDPKTGKEDNPCGPGFAPGAQSGIKTKIGAKSKRRVSRCEKIKEDSIVEKKKYRGKDPKKGTGKKPPNSPRRLYTDENPKDTVRVEFRTASAIRRTLSKKSFKSKSHKRQSQIINLIHQRARAAYKNAKDPKTKKRLKRAFDYASERKEASKRKTQRMRKKK